MYVHVQFQYVRISFQEWPYTHSTWSTTVFPRTHAPKYTLPTCQYICAIPANTWNNKTWPSSTKLHGTTSRSWLEWRSTNSWRCLKTVKPGTNLWSRVLIYNRPTRERLEREDHILKKFSNTAVPKDQKVLVFDCCLLELPFSALCSDIGIFVVIMHKVLQLDRYF